MLTFRQLRYLMALAEHRHFGRAADACSVTQPALSMQIRELEMLLDAPLVERRPGDVILTPVGRDVVARGREILTAARDLVDAASHVNQVLVGGLSFGVIPTIAPYLLPLILPKLQKRYPRLKVELRETQTKVLLDELTSGQLDVILLALPIGEPDIETMALFHDPFLLAVPADDPRPRSARIAAGDIEHDRLILLEEGHCLRDQALAFCAHAGRNRSIRSGAIALGATGLAATGLAATGLGAIGLGATSLATVMQMVANGYGVTLLPEVAVAVEGRDDRVKLLRFASPPPGRSIGLAWRRTSPRKPDFAALGKLIIETVGAASSRRAPTVQTSASLARARRSSTQ